MSLYFLNLAIRFVLEMTALIGVGIWAWGLSDGGMRYVFAIGIPMMMSAIWGVFNVKGDPSRSGNAPVVVPGLLRLLIELIFFAFGAWTLIAAGHTSFGQVFIVIVIIHYLASFNRVSWLLKN